jgi:hypothetical protein
MTYLHEALLKSSLAPAAQRGGGADAAFADAAFGGRGLECFNDLVAHIVFLDLARRFFEMAIALVVHAGNGHVRVGTCSRSSRCMGFGEVRVYGQTNGAALADAAFCRAHSGRSSGCIGVVGPAWFVQPMVWR